MTRLGREEARRASEIAVAADLIARGWCVEDARDYLDSVGAVMLEEHERRRIDAKAKRKWVSALSLALSAASLATLAAALYW